MTVDWDPLQVPEESFLLAQDFSARFSKVLDIVTIPGRRHLLLAPAPPADSLNRHPAEARLVDRVWGRLQAQLIIALVPPGESGDWSGTRPSEVRRLIEKEWVFSQPQFIGPVEKLPAKLKDDRLDRLTMAA